MFGKTLVREFHISYNHTKWNFLFSLSENRDKNCKQSAFNKLNSKINSVIERSYEVKIVHSIIWTEILEVIMTENKVIPENLVVVG